MVYVMAALILLGKSEVEVNPNSETMSDPFEIEVVPGRDFFFTFSLKSSSKWFFC